VATRITAMLPRRGAAPRDARADARPEPSPRKALVDRDAMVVAAVVLLLLFYVSTLAFRLTDVLGGWLSRVGAIGTDDATRLILVLALSILWYVHRRWRAHGSELRTLKERDERLSNVIPNAPVILFAVDREGVVTLAEGKGLDAVGLRAVAVVGRSIADLGGALPEFNEFVCRALTGELFTAVFEPEASGRAFEMHFTPVLDEDDHLSGFICVATDITARKRAADALKALNEALEMRVE
jgi:PAS domain S-box-containing protein